MQCGGALAHNMRAFRGGRAPGLGIPNLVSARLTLLRAISGAYLGPRTAADAQRTIGARAVRVPLRTFSHSRQRPATIVETRAREKVRPLFGGISGHIPIGKGPAQRQVVDTNRGRATFDQVWRGGPAPGPTWGDNSSSSRGDQEEEEEKEGGTRVGNRWGDHRRARVYARGNGRPICFKVDFGRKF